MAEYMDDDPAWDSDVDHLGPVVLDQLGVSEGLVQRLRAWNEHFNGIALTGLQFGSVDEQRHWEQEGLRLAYERQGRARTSRPLTAPTTIRQTYNQQCHARFAA
jgi:hypothetical protein